MFNRSSTAALAGNAKYLRKQGMHEAAPIHRKNYTKMNTETTTNTAPDLSNTVLADVWISVNESLPSIDSIVLIYSKPYIKGNAAVAFYDDGKWHLYHSESNDDPIKSPDYWMPFPSPPDFS